jgi:flagellar protein FlaG
MNTINTTPQTAAPQPLEAIPAQRPAVKDAPSMATESPATAVAQQAIANSAQDRAKLQEAIVRLNEHMQKSSTQLTFSVDDSLNQVVVLVKNQETGNVVRQIPNEAALRMAHHFEDLRGFLQDSKI